MAADLTLEPFKRLAALAPPSTGEAELQAAADRYAAIQDLYAAAADLWDEAALRLNLTTSADATDPQIASVSQDGISVSYARKATTQDSTFKTHGAYKQIARDLRKRSKPSTPLIIGPEPAVDRYDEDPLDPYEFDPDNGIIEIANWGD